MPRRGDVLACEDFPRRTWLGRLLSKVNPLKNGLLRMASDHFSVMITARAEAGETTLCCHVTVGDVTDGSDKHGSAYRDATLAPNLSIGDPRDMAQALLESVLSQLLAAQYNDLAQRRLDEAASKK
ncbi:MAG TPA: hypothetical protein VF748_14865 [Candidatus Acidoferrum sp.]